MNGIGVLKAQLVTVHQMLRTQVAAIRPEEWAARPAPGMNMPGYTLWHIPVTQDWVARTAVRGLPEVRMQGRWAAHAGINPNLPPFGCTVEQADTVARTVTPADILAYAGDVQNALLAWLDTINEAELDRLPDLATNSRRYPAARITEGYLLEVKDMMAWNVARFLASACIGHVRGHFGELDVHLALLRERAA